MKCISFFWEEVHCKHLRITNRPAPLSVRGPQLWQTVPLYTQTKFWPWTPGGPRQRDRRIEWPSVIKCLWLCENFFPHSSYCLNKQLLKISFCVFCFCFKNSPTIAHICSWRLICQAHSNFPVKYFFFFFYLKHNRFLSFCRQFSSQSIYCLSFKEWRPLRCSVMRVTASLRTELHFAPNSFSPRKPTLLYHTHLNIPARCTIACSSYLHPFLLR